MPKSPNAPVLLELIQRHPVQQPASCCPSEPSVPAASSEPNQESNASAEISAPSTTESHSVSTPTAESEPAIPIKPEDHRIHFSISRGHLALGAATLLIAFVAVYKIGRHAGFLAGQTSTSADQAQPVDESIQTARKQAPQPQVLEGLSDVNHSVKADEARAESARIEPTAGWIKGLNYLWVDTFNSETDAVKAQDFLRQHEIEASVVQTESMRTGGKCVLVVNRGYDYRIPEHKQACERQVAQVKEIGKEYLKAGGRYQFNCLIKKLTADHW